MFRGFYLPSLHSVSLCGRYYRISYIPLYHILTCYNSTNISVAFYASVGRCQKSVSTCQKCFSIYANEKNLTRREKMPKLVNKKREEKTWPKKKAYKRQVFWNSKGSFRRDMNFNISGFFFLYYILSHLQHFWERPAQKAKILFFNDMQKSSKYDSLSIFYSHHQIYFKTCLESWLDNSFMHCNSKIYFKISSKTTLRIGLLFSIL